MNISLFPLLNARDKTEFDQVPVVTVPRDHNTSEGSEFLDDAIRIKEQPLVYTEESIAPGSPKGMI